jgi:hypothetical protein
VPEENAPTPVDASPVQTTIGEPTKLLRMGTMTQELLAELRRAPLDPQARQRLKEIHERTLAELKEILPPELQEELSDITLPMQDDPSEAELRLAQAQLVGWLQGLFHGIQASMYSQLMQSQQAAQGLPRPKRDETGQYL